jgi:hypothetical protein
LGDDDYYAILAAKSLRIQNRVSPILKVLSFLCEPSARELQSAIEHFKNKDGVIDKAAPVGFLSLDERKAVTKDAKFLVPLYKALLFLHVQGAIKSGTLNLKHSYKYRPLDEYLIDRDRWHRDKAVLIERAQLQPFVDPHRVIAELDEALSRQYVITNTNIHEGKNRTSNSRTPVLLSARRRRKRVMRSLCSSSFPSGTIFRFWRSWPPSIAIATGWTSYSTGSSATIMVVPRNKLSTRALSESVAPSVSAKWPGSLTRSANRHWSIPSIGTFRSTTSLPPTIACFDSWIGWNYRT